MDGRQALAWVVFCSERLIWLWGVSEPLIQEGQVSREAVLQMSLQWEGLVRRECPASGWECKLHPRNTGQSCRGMWALPGLDSQLCHLGKNDITCASVSPPVTWEELSPLS